MSGLREDCECKQPIFDVFNGICKSCKKSIIHLGERVEVQQQISELKEQRDEMLQMLEKLYEKCYLSEFQSETYQLIKKVKNE
jgi:hypothetical protein